MRRWWPKLHYLVHSAGIIRGEPVITSEGVESNFAVNYLSRFTLTTALLPLLEAAGSPGRTYFIGQSPEQAAAPALRLLLDDQYEGVSGALFLKIRKFRRIVPGIGVLDPAAGARLWELSLQLAGKHPEAGARSEDPRMDIGVPGADIPRARMAAGSLGAE